MLRAAIIRPDGFNVCQFQSGGGGEYNIVYEKKRMTRNTQRCNRRKIHTYKIINTSLYVINANGLEILSGPFSSVQYLQVTQKKNQKLRLKPKETLCGPLIDANVCRVYFHVFVWRKLRCGKRAIISV